MYLDRFILGYAILFAAHLSVSYSNDYFDTDVDQYTTSTIFSGGSKILIKHPELRKFSKWFAIGLTALSISLAVVFIVVFSFSTIFLIYVILGNFLGWFYTAPPLRLTYRGLGEFSTAITAGILLPGMGYLVIRGWFDFSFALFIIPFLLYGFAFIVNVEIPDMDADRRGNKKTLIVRKGQRIGFILTAAVLSLATLYFLIISQLKLIPSIIDFWLIALFSLIPLSFGIGSIFKQNPDQIIATKLVTNNVLSLFLLFILINCYFLFLLIF